MKTKQQNYRKLSKTIKINKKFFLKQIMNYLKRIKNMKNR